ncbi:lactoylglutathione lyase [Aspergillus stella-maris]|uniref:lactoylglutathione lyase n=1 Tax=Aspergillus stella-maris TaxID=1810926 RepID=UPI003CCDABB4
MTDLTTYKLNHSMIRVKDPKASLEFYSHLGLSVLQEFHLPQHRQDLFFLAFGASSPGSGDSPASISHGTLPSDREGVLELSYNYGIERTHNGNTEPKGFSHLCISVDNIDTACKSLAQNGYTFQKHFDPQDGHAVVLDPDEYWIMIIPQYRNPQDAEVTTADTQTYRFNHTMLRVKDKETSIRFYQEVCGMTLKHTFHNHNAGYDSYYLGYGLKATIAHGLYPNGREHEGLLGLTWYYGTEKQDGLVYHGGNTEPEGFGHICISVDDTGLACERLEQYGVSWVKRLKDGPFRIAFLTDPDGYLIEIIQNERFKPPGHEF